MKTILAVVCLALLGVGVGVAVAIMDAGSGVRLEVLSEESRPGRKKLLEREAKENVPGTTGSSKHAGNGDSTTKSVANKPQPVAVVDNATFDFGAAKFGSSSNHVFRITNKGRSVLELPYVSVSCNKCTSVEIPKRQAAPGETLEVIFHYTIRNLEDTFSQTATVTTNDPTHERLTLRVTGKVVQAYQLTPTELVFSNVRATASVSATAVLLAQFSPDLEITSHELADKSAAEFFDVQVAKVPLAELPPTAKSACRITLTIQPGLPMGAIRQSIHLKTNLPELPSLEIPVKGVVVGDISIVGRGWDRVEGQLDFGVVRAEKGASRKLKLIVRGPHHADLKLETPQATPAMLRVTLGEMTQIQGKNSSAGQIPITVEIPPNAQEDDELDSTREGQGDITIATNQPDIGVIRLRVRFTLDE